MIKRIAHSALAASLAFLLLFGTTAKEFVHLFAGHTDTVHLHHHHGLVLEPEHHHCSFLSFSLTPFMYSVDAPAFAQREVVYHYHFAATVVHLTTRVVTAPGLRGPPALAV